jgi:hypothetical protein
MDGFFVNKSFFCKEFGFLSVGDDTAQSFFFDTGLQWNDLTPKTKEHADTSKNIFINYLLVCPLESMSFLFPVFLR